RRPALPRGAARRLVRRPALPLRRLVRQDRAPQVPQAHRAPAALRPREAARSLHHARLRARSPGARARRLLVDERSAHPAAAAPLHPPPAPPPPPHRPPSPPPRPP